MIIQNLLYLSKFGKPYPLARKMSYLNSDGLIPDSPGKPRFGKVKIMLMVSCGVTLGSMIARNIVCLLEDFDVYYHDEEED